MKCHCNKTLRYLIYRHKLVGEKDNVALYYNRILFLLSLLAQCSKERFKRPAAANKTGYSLYWPDQSGPSWSQQADGKKPVSGGT